MRPVPICVTNAHLRSGKDWEAAVRVECQASSRFPDQQRDDVPIVSHTGARLMCDSTLGIDLSLLSSVIFWEICEKHHY